VTAPGITVDELARRVGMTVRNIRAHQSRGLLPPPEVAGRTGYYGDVHVARLELIKDLQGEGLNLKAIEHVLSQVPHGAEQEVLDFRRTLLDSWTPDEIETVDLDDLAASMGVPADPDDPQLAAAVRLGILEPLGEDRYVVISPSLLRAGAEVVQLGVPLDEALGLTKLMRKHADAISAAFVELFLEHVWRPFVADGQPEDAWPGVRDALARLQPLAGQAVMATLDLSMAKAVETAMGNEESLGASGDAARRTRRSSAPRRRAASPAGSGRRRRS
jgi:DNA-binding transcriptional MerR regulator